MTKKWSVEFKPRVFKELKKLDKTSQKKIIEFLERLSIDYTSPREIGAALQGTYKGFWRYRVGDVRIICDIQDHQLIVLVLEIGHRKEIYM